FTYPFVAHALFGHDSRAAGLFLGTAIHDTAQVAGAGLMYQQQFHAPRALDTATVTKLVRNLCMVGVIPLVGALYHRGGAPAAAPRAAGPGGAPEGAGPAATARTGGSGCRRRSRCSSWGSSARRRSERSATSATGRSCWSSGRRGTTCSPAPTPWPPGA